VGYFDAEFGSGREGAEGCDENGGETHCVCMVWIWRGIGEMRSLGMWTDKEIRLSFSVGLCFKLMV
jgi:hypothetical protein